jgi:hypothetical protein
MNESIPENFFIQRLEDKNGNEDTVNISKKEEMFYTNKKV